MWLPRFTDCWRHGLAALALLGLAACAGGPDTRPSEGDEPVRAGDGQADGEDARVVPPQVLTLYEQAVSIMAAGDFVDAELRFKEFLLQYPDYPGAHVNLAIIYMRGGDDAGAEGSITDALILDPQHPAALNQLGMLLRRQGKFKEAESAYLKAVTASPDYALAHYNLGVLNDLYLQRLDVALMHYERYQEIAGEDDQVTKWIADLKRRLGAAHRTANVTE